MNTNTFVSETGELITYDTETGEVVSSVPQTQDVEEDVENIETTENEKSVETEVIASVEPEAEGVSADAPVKPSEDKKAEKVPSRFTTTRRVHTSKNVTIRESGILLFLLDKLARSSKPASYEGSDEVITAAFVECGKYAVATFDEAEAQVAAMRAASDLTEDEKSQLERAERHLRDAEAHREKSDIDELIAAAAA